MTDKYSELLSFPFLKSYMISSVVWAVEGVKPVSGFQLNGICEKDISRLTSILKGYGLSIIRRDEIFTTKADTVLITLLDMSLVPKRLEAVTKLELIRDQICNKTLLREYGLIYGYPESAIQGFAEREILESMLILESFYTLEEILSFVLLSTFRLSLHHWETEAQLLKEWTQVFLDVAPTTYGQLRKQWLESE